MRAYVATAHRLIGFLGRYRGEQIGSTALLEVSAADLRAFLASRRGEGLGASSAARELSGVRAFLKYAAAQAGSHATLPRTRAPKRPRTLPRPAAPDEALELAVDAAEAAHQPWIAARDLAILLLLYGSGLRVAEALSLLARVLPIGATLRVTGKRSKTRVVPVLPAVREAIEAYVRQSPYPLTGDVPLFVGARGGPLNPDLVRRSVAAARRRLGLPETPHTLMLLGTALQPTCWLAEQTSARFRSCSVTPAFPRHRFIRRWTQRIFWTCIATPTPAPEQRLEAIF